MKMRVRIGIRIRAFFLTVLLGLTAVSFAQAKSILISDIDDTLKIAHVLDRAESLQNALRIENIFSGMNILYRVLGAHDPAMKFFYVSNAPRAFMEGAHRDFLTLHQFPLGELRLRPNIFDGAFKVREIREILKNENPTTVILVGDNAEKDTLIYDQIQQEHSGIRFITYIHTSYSNQDLNDRGALLENGQVGYVTAWDLLLHWRQEGLISDSSAREFLQYFAPAFLQEPEHLKVGAVVIPSWFDCRDFRWTAADTDFVSFNEHHFVKEKILKRCSR